MPFLFAQLCFLRPYRNYLESRLFYGAADFFVFDGAVVGDYRGFGFEAYPCGGSVDFVYRFGDAADAVVAVHTGDFYRFSAEDGAVEPFFGGGLDQAGAAASAAGAFALEVFYSAAHGEEHERGYERQYYGVSHSTHLPFCFSSYFLRSLPLMNLCPQ